MANLWLNLTLMILVRFVLTMLRIYVQFSWGRGDGFNQMMKVRLCFVRACFNFQPSLRTAPDLRYISCFYHTPSSRLTNDRNRFCNHHDLQLISFVNSHSNTNMISGWDLQSFGFDGCSLQAKTLHPVPSTRNSSGDECASPAQYCSSNLWTSTSWRLFRRQNGSCSCRKAVE
jgi:hypothetical protein